MRKQFGPLFDRGGMPSEVAQFLQDVPPVHLNPEKPLAESWLIILLFGTYCGFLMSMLMVTSTVISLTELVLIFLINAFGYGLFALWVQVPKTGNGNAFTRLLLNRLFSSLLAPVLLVFLYPITYLLNLYAVAGSLPAPSEIVMDPSFLISVVQTSMLTFWLALYSVPIQPALFDGMDRKRSFLPIYLDNWWRAIKFCATGIITFAVGVVITFSLTLQGQDIIGDSASVIAVHVVTTSPLGIIIGVYLSMKHMHVLKMMEKEFKD